MDLKAYTDEQGRQRLKWKCPLCPHEWHFHRTDFEDIAFLVVHHLASRHRLNANEVSAYDTSLNEEIEEHLWPVFVTETS